jgi:tRNA 2-thiouridine synthesizing protein E
MLKTDKEGFLLDLNDWSESVANQLAINDQLKLTEDHWHVIYFLRDFYQQYQTAPTVRVLVKELAKKLGDEKGNSIYLQRLFPGGLLRQGSKIAGLPKPTRCV